MKPSKIVETPLTHEFIRLDSITGFTLKCYMKKVTKKTENIIVSQLAENFAFVSNSLSRKLTTLKLARQLGRLTDRCPIRNNGIR